MLHLMSRDTRLLIETEHDMSEAPVLKQTRVTVRDVRKAPLFRALAK